jgi:hypothetical protein
VRRPAALPFLHFAPDGQGATDPMRASTKLKNMIETGKTFMIPGAYDGISARIVQNVGAEAVYATGGGIARSTGIPDMGLMSLKEITDRLETMVDAVDIPLIANSAARLRTRRRRGLPSGGSGISQALRPLRRQGRGPGRGVLRQDARGPRCGYRR